MHTMLNAGISTLEEEKRFISHLNPTLLFLPLSLSFLLFAGCTNAMYGFLKICSKHGGGGYCQHPSGCIKPTRERTAQTSIHRCHRRASAEILACLQRWWCSPPRRTAYSSSHHCVWCNMLESTDCSGGHPSDLHHPCAPCLPQRPRAAARVLQPSMMLSFVLPSPCLKHSPRACAAVW